MRRGTASPATSTPDGAPDLVCLSHLRWDLVFQRPQHLLSCAARDRRVYFLEEPVRGEGADRLEMRDSPEGVRICTPHLSGSSTGEGSEMAQKALLDQLLLDEQVRDFILWYYTPMALGIARHLQPRATVYDVMDELSLFRFAPPALLEREQELYEVADLVFTGGASLHSAKRHRHDNVHLFPSSVDVEHFASARQRQPDPEEQAGIPWPRLGFFGVIDERIDLVLLSRLADARPDWHVVMIGPVVKIDPLELPRRPNLHYLGARPYTDLPRFAAGWDVALMPWARNDATRFISPTKTPEYLAAGLPVISTPITDVVRPYGEAGLVRVSATAEGFVREIEAALSEPARVREGWQREVDLFLGSSSWSRTWDGMQREIASVLANDHPGRVAQPTPRLSSMAAD